MSDINDVMWMCCEYVMNVMNKINILINYKHWNDCAINLISIDFEQHSTLS